MRYCRNLFITSLAVIGAFGALPLWAALKPTGFPQTFQDVPFTKRMETKQAGYEPYKDMKAYVIPDFKDTDRKFKDELCERDREECCRRWPDYSNKIFSCKPQIRYETYGGKADKCPTFYYTDRGETISCIPTRDSHSIFKGWCTDAAHKHCAMVQTIAIGEKDDKVYYADWDCQSPWIEKNNKCVCPDPNMDDKCECSGTGMWENPSNNMCECIANSDTDRLSDAVIQNKNCVCVDPLLDINSNCKARLTACPDTPHQNPADCSCYAAPNAKPDGAGMCKCVDKSDVEDPYQQIVGTGSAQQCQCKDTTLMEIDTTTGKCVCKDRTLDINTNPTCDSVSVGFRFWYCRAKPGNAATLLHERENGHTVEFGNAYCKSQMSGFDCISRPTDSEGIVNQIFRTSTGESIALRDGTQMYNIGACPTAFNNLSCLNFNISQTIVDKFIQDLVAQRDTVKGICLESKREWYLLIDQFDGTDYVPYKTICIGGQCVAGKVIDY